MSHWVPTSIFLTPVTLITSKRWGFAAILPKRVSETIALTLQTPSERTYLNISVRSEYGDNNSTYFCLILAEACLSGLWTTSSIFSTWRMRSTFLGTSRAGVSWRRLRAWGVRTMGGGVDVVFIV